MFEVARYPVRVTHGTMKRLKSLSVYPNESYDRILTRILDAKIGEEVIVYSLVDTMSNCKLKCVIDYGKDEENILFYENDNAKESMYPPLVYAGNDVTGEEYSMFLFRLRGIKNLISVLAMLGRREYTVVNDIKLIRM